jgi:hypothetical protein
MTYKAYDQHFTPQQLAVSLIQDVKIDNPLIIFDPTCGNGALLEAAYSKWPAAKFFGNDIDIKMRRRLKRQRQQWNISVSNFIMQSKRKVSYANLKADLILLNPPFSCRGGSYKVLKTRIYEGKCSTALAFFIRAIEFLSDSGEIVAILPSSVISSQKDKLALDWLRKYGVFSIIRQYASYSFPLCSVDTISVHFKCKPDLQSSSALNMSCSDDQNNVNTAILPQKNEKLVISRGQMQMHVYKVTRKKQDSVIFIHTDNLQNNNLVPSRLAMRSSVKIISGPALLLPRVGKPDPRKIVLIENSIEFSVSDCVIVVSAKLSKLRRVKSLLINNWELLKECYSGSCAKYLTLKNLGDLLERIT